jgi:hypothetical protein
MTLKEEDIVQALNGELLAKKILNLESDKSPETLASSTEHTAME